MRKENRGVYTVGNGSSRFQAELGDKFPPLASRIFLGLNSMGKEIILKYKK